MASFWDEYQQWWNDVVGQFRGLGLMSTNEADAVVNSSFTAEEMLRALPKPARDRAKDTLLDILGANPNAVRTGAPSNLEEVMRLPQDRIYYRFARSQVDTPQNIILRHIGVTYDPLKPIGDQYSVSAQLPSPSWAKRIVETAGPAPLLSPGQKVVSLDIETTGLIPGSDIVEYSGRTYGVGTAGELVEGSEISHAFDSRGLQTGIIRNGGRTQTLLEFMKSQLPERKGTKWFAAGGDAFVEGMIDPLRQLANADVIMGQNVRFDLQFIFESLRKTGAYTANKDVAGVGQFATFVDNLWERISANDYGPGSLADGRSGISVVDTLLMSQDKFPQMKPDPWLQATGVPRSSSLQNYMLNSDFLNWLKVTYPNDYDYLVSSAHHRARFDTKATARFYEWMGSSNPQVNSPFGLDYTDGPFRKKLIESGALTAVTNQPLENIDPQIFNDFKANEDVFKFYLVDRTGAGTDPYKTLGLSDVEDLMRKAGRKDLYDFLVNSQDIMVDTHLSPLEQRVLLERRLNLPLPTASTSASGLGIGRNLGQWEWFTGIKSGEPGVGRENAILTRSGALAERAIVPTMDEMEWFQSEMARIGNPFPGLSWDERRLTGVIASAAEYSGSLQDALGSSPIQAWLADVDLDLGATRWARQTEAFAGPSGAIGLPFELMRQLADDFGLGAGSLSGWESLRANQPTMLRMSIMPKDVRWDPKVNLLYDIAQEEIGTAGEGKLLDYFLNLRGADLETLELADGVTFAEAGLTRETLEGIIEGLQSGRAAEYGITIGSISGQGARAIQRGTEDIVQGTPDRSRVNVRLPFFGVDQDVAMTGPAMIGPIKDPSELARGMTEFGRQEKALSVLATTSPDDAATISRRVAAGANAFGVSDMAAKAYKAVTRKLPIVAGLTAAAFGVAALFGRNREEELYDAPFEAQPTGPNQNPNVVMRSTPNRSTSYLTEAEIPWQMWENRSYHTNMSNTKHNSLFGGALR